MSTWFSTGVGGSTRHLEPLATGQVRIWYVLTESWGEPTLARARALLSDEERSRHDRYRLACDRRDYAVSHALLRASLSCDSEVEPQAWTFGVGVYGKPELTIRAGLAAIRD